MVSLNLQAMGGDWALPECPIAFDLIKNSFFCLAIFGFYSVAKKLDERNVAKLNKERMHKKENSILAKKEARYLMQRADGVPLRMPSSNATVLGFMQQKKLRRGSSDSALLKRKS